MFFSMGIEKNKNLQKEILIFVAKLGLVVRLVLVAMTVALQH
jgi:hypothetical protein